MLTKIKSIGKPLVGLLGVLVVIAQQLLALKGFIAPQTALELSAFVAVATPVVAYFAPYAPAKAMRRPRSASRRARKPRS